MLRADPRDRINRTRPVRRRGRTLIALMVLFPLALVTASAITAASLFYIANTYPEEFNRYLGRVIGFLDPGGP